MSKPKLNIVELDVRPQLRNKIEPFQIIMETVKKLKKDDALVLHATFKPTPLLGVLKVRGYINHVEKKASDHWVVTFVKKKHRTLLAELVGQDLSGLQVEALNERDVSELDVASDRSESEKRDDKSDRPPKTIELDNRGLQPPQPMMRTLAALERSVPGDEVNIHNDRVPVFLIEELAKMGYTYTVNEQTDGSAKVNIKKN